MAANSLDKIAIVESAFAPLACSCQPEGNHLQIRVTQHGTQGDTLLYDAHHGYEELDSLRSTAQLVLEIRQHLSTNTSVGTAWKRKGLLG